MEGRSPSPEYTPANARLRPTAMWPPYQVILAASGVAEATPLRGIRQFRGERPGITPPPQRYGWGRAVLPVKRWPP
jgi:hypothetical protein